jgi:hypothetical protein
MSEFQVGYDLNVWDEGRHNGEEESRWKINVHTLNHLDGSGYQLGDLLADELYLTPAEAQQLTLGFSEEFGGVYGPDLDFFLDPLGFLGIYEDVMPARVKEFVEKYL